MYGLSLLSPSAAGAASSTDASTGGLTVSLVAFCLDFLFLDPFDSVGWVSCIGSLIASADISQDCQGGLFVSFRGRVGFWKNRIDIHLSSDCKFPGFCRDCKRVTVVQRCLSDAGECMVQRELDPKYRGKLWVWSCARKASRFTFYPLLSLCFIRGIHRRMGSFSMCHSNRFIIYIIYWVSR